MLHSFKSDSSFKSKILFSFGSWCVTAGLWTKVLSACCLLASFRLNNVPESSRALKNRRRRKSKFLKFDRTLTLFPCLLCIEFVWYSGWRVLVRCIYAPLKVERLCKYHRTSAGLRTSSHRILIILALYQGTEKLSTVCVIINQSKLLPCEDISNFL